MLLTACGKGETDAAQSSADQEKAAEGAVSISGATAASMHLVRTEGEVYVSDDTGKSLEPRENLGLYSGYELSTEKESYSWINLDDVKLAKMDQSSKIAIQKEEKNLEVKVGLLGKSVLQCHRAPCRRRNHEHYNIHHDGRHPRHLRVGGKPGRRLPRVLIGGQGGMFLRRAYFHNKCL